MKILSVVGARPQFVKEAAMQAELKKHDEIEEVLVHTGQHYDVNMSDVFFEVLSIKEPKYNLGITSNLHGEMTGRMIIELEKIMIQEKPDLVLLYGDTNSTAAGALAATKLKIEIAHVEAGFRQKKPKYMPEETNRVVTDHVSDYLFCASRTALKNLKREGIVQNAYFSGDVMYDVYLKMKPHFRYHKMDELGLKKNGYVILTLHRDSNVDDKDRMIRIFNQINRLSEEIPVLLPLHPRTKKRMEEFGLTGKYKKVIFTEPLDYLELMGLTENCYKAVTDSGGYQKETYFAQKQAAVLMPETGWIELITKGINKIVEPDEICDFIFETGNPKFEKNIYGRGCAAESILKIIMEK